MTGRAEGWLRWIHWAPVTVLALEAVAAVLTRSGIGTVIVVVLISEAVVAVLVLAVLAVQMRRAHRAGHTWRRAFAVAVTRIAPPLLIRAVRREALMIEAVGRWVMRRHSGVPPGSCVITYGRDQIALIAVFAVLTVVDVVAIEILVPWPWARFVLLLLGCYGLVIMSSFVAVNRTRPHVLTADHLRLRSGLLADIKVELTEISAVATGFFSAPYRPTIDRQVLTIGVGGQARIEIVLHQARDFTIGAVVAPADRIRIAADAPATAHRIINDSLEAVRPE